MERLGHHKKRPGKPGRDRHALLRLIPNFAETFRTVAGPNNSERQKEFFIVYFDGFILLVMGYTGKKALQVKLAYIAAFNAMRDELAA